jgi:hypothetical protein
MEGIGLKIRLWRWSRSRNPTAPRKDDGQKAEGLKLISGDAQVRFAQSR